MPKEQIKRLQSQKRALEAIIDVANCLFEGRDVLGSLTCVVTTIGVKFEADRCFIYGKGLTKSFIETDFLQLAVYVKEESKIEAQNYECFEFVNDKDNFKGVFEDLLEVGYYDSAATKNKIDALSKYNIGYVISYPLFINKKLWGFVGISKSSGGSPLEGDQKNALQTISKNISSAIEKFFITRQLDDTKLELLCINQNLEAAAANAISEKLKIEQEKLQRERELFEVREKYHLLQQDDAYKKQIKILKDDLSHKLNGRFLFESFYKPLDILSGDIYGIIKLSSGVSFVYIIDAMGKGLSASVTAVVSAAFLNDYMQKWVANGIFDFDDTVATYHSFIKRQITEDEIVCAVFAQIDEEANTLKVANFAMPEILLLKNKSLLKFGANNHPITSYFDAVKIESISLEGVERILLSSDGINDLISDKMWLDEKFFESQTKNIFLKKLFSNSATPNDDLSFIFISRYEPLTKKSESFKAAPNLDSITGCIEESIKGELSMFFDGKALMQLECAINELLMNALEHGILGVTYDQKNALLESFCYEEYLEEAIKNLENIDGKEIRIFFEEVLLGEDKAVIIKISDGGNGFDVSKTLKLLSFDKNVRFNGRGILMSDNILDALFYNESGNEACLIKFFEKEF